MIALPRSAASQARELDRHRAKAIKTVNQGVGEARSAFITVIPGQEMVYQAKEAEAKVYVTLAPEPTTLDDFPLLAAEVGLTAPSAYELAQLWLNMSAQWRGVAAQLETLRLGTVGAIETAPDRAAIEAAVESALNSLEMF